ncbi:MAG TPA: HNH endonuclease [Polyangiaceae bacterium]|nr:HNH endonuclease [Polyangiaceae bacterium]
MAPAIVLELEGASWRQAHEALVRLATKRAGLDFEEGRWLLRAHRAGVHLRFGYASFSEYTERLFGYGHRLTQEKLRAAVALEELPQIARSLETGAVSFSLARELTRVATPATETEWLEAAQGKTVREVEQLVRGHRPGSLPDDVPDTALERHVLQLELSGEVFATYREAMAKIRRDAGEALDDDAAFLLLCREALEGPKDAGRASYQIAVTVCESCRRATQQGRGELVEVGPEVVEMAECDGQRIGDADARAHVCAAPVRATQSIPPAIRRAVSRRDGGKCRVPGCRHAVFTDAHHIELRSEDGKHELENLITLCAAHHRAVHAGTLLITGSASSPSFAHADGTPYGGAVGSAVADARAKAFQALTAMGFREGEAKRALARIPTSVSPLEQVIRQALRELAPR